LYIIVGYRKIRPFNYIKDFSERYLVSFDLVKYESDKFIHLNPYEFLKIIY